MVMQVEVRHEESFRSLPDEDVQVVLLEEQDYSRNNANASMLSMGRDTSNTCRDVSLDNTRQTVNTHDSILDLTKDEEEDDEDDDYWNRHDGILFDDLQTLSREDYSTYDEDDDESSPIPTEPTSLLSKFTFDHVTDSFVDSLCPVVMMSSCSTSRFQTPCASTTRTTLCVPQQRVQISMDVWKLLGCNAAPDDAELESIWSLRTSPVEKAPGKPVRTHMTNRLQRIHRLRMARMSGPTRHGITLAGPHVMERSYTMNDHHPLAEVIGKGMDPILPEQEDGYDSDPEIGGSTVMAATTPRFPSSHSPLLDQEEGEPTDLEEQDRMIQETVQQTLNSTWTLTWHPNPENSKEFQISKPICINIWIERGTVMAQSGVVVEPTLMWRDAYQPQLQKHRLNASSQNPWSMRLLNTCRISTDVDKHKYPLARPSQSLTILTCEGQEFLLEAASPQECQMVCERWKLAVARFASLAVTEDIDAIAAEFFHPTNSVER